MKIFKILSKSIRTKLILFFFVISAVPIIIIGIISYNSSKNALNKSVENSIVSVVDSRVSHIQDFLTMSLDAVINGSNRNLFRENVKNIEEGRNIEASRKIIQTELEAWATKSNVIYRAKILDTNGDIIATSKSVFDDMGTNRKDSAYFREGLKGPFISDPYISNDDHVAMITYACPIADFDDSKKTIGVMIIHQATDPTKNKGSFWGKGIGINQITANAEGLGESGETYLINKDGLILTDSRFDKNIAFQKKINKTTLDGYLATNMLSIQSDYEGHETFGLARKITNTDWLLVCEFNSSEVLAPAKNLGYLIFIISIIILGIVIVLAIVVSRYFTHPLAQITNVAKAMALGDLNQNISVSLTDEIGQLAQSFKTMQQSLKDKEEMAKKISDGNLMIDITPLSEKDSMGYSFQTMVIRLRSQLKDISEGINVLASSSAEIMAAVSQLATSSAETATAVGETTTTVEEVKQTALVSNNKAKMVSDNAFRMTEISIEGNKSIANTLDGMSRIKNQMNAIAGMVVKLSEQSQTIGEITATVNEFAEQSNLLAVNAAIEAAKAGEQGKGFTVVAQEIKLLANRSKDATAQVRSILRDIQKSISSAVMATEEGSKAVEEGLKLTTKSGETIKTLSDSISEASNAAIQIAASSQQQLEGMDQMVIAMESIKEASIQAVTGTQQSVDSVNELQKVGQKLDEMMKQYKLS